MEFVLLWGTALVCYALVHELAHYVAARIVGCRAKLGISTDGLWPSLSVSVVCRQPSRYRDLVILYSPYLLNLALALMPAATPPTYIVKGVAIATLPNLILEGEERSLIKLAAAACLAAAASITAFLCMA